MLRSGSLHLVIAGGIAAVCTPHMACSLGAPSGTKANENQSPNPKDPGPVLAAYQACGAPLPSQCVSGYTCTYLDEANQSYCLRPCANESPCADGESCVAAFGVCLKAVAFYDVCGAVLESCAADGFCYSDSNLAANRCLPVCARGQLAAGATVAACPPIEPFPSAPSPTCTAMPSSNPLATFCAVDVEVGHLCDESLLRCNPDGLRPSTEPSPPAPTTGGLSAGALACIGTDGYFQCIRVCSTDDGATESACACPGDDPLCADPTEPGAQWSCVGYDALPSGTRVCVELEPCESDAVCSGNIQSGKVACGNSPYNGGPEKICVRP